MGHVVHVDFRPSERPAMTEARRALDALGCAYTAWRRGCLKVRLHDGQDVYFNADTGAMKIGTVFYFGGFSKLCEIIMGAET
jgi:hypothetical protein